MTILLIGREYLQKLYSRYSLQITIALKFILGCFVFHTINANLGFMDRLDNPVVVVGLAALSSFLPLMTMVLGAILLIAAHLYAISLPVMVVTVLIFIMLYIFYFRFTPGKTWAILLVPIAFFFDVPLVIPIVFGLLGSPLMIVPAIAGTIVFYILYYIKTTEAIYAAEGISEMIEVTVYFITSIIVSPYQWLMAFVMGVGVLITYAIRSRSFDHSWKVAIATGVVWLFAGVHLGTAFLELEEPIVLLVFNLIVAVIVGIILEFFFFRVDYSRTEYMQFDDNEYYYYVKAIPKRFSDEWQRKQEAVREIEAKQKEEEIERRKSDLRTRDGQEGRHKEDGGPRGAHGQDPKFRGGGRPRGGNGQDPRLRGDRALRGGYEQDSRFDGNDAPRSGYGQDSRFRDDGNPRLRNGQDSGFRDDRELQEPRVKGRQDPGPRKERAMLSGRQLSELLPNSPIGFMRKKGEEEGYSSETTVVDTNEINLNVKRSGSRPESRQGSGGKRGSGGKKSLENKPTLDESLGLDPFEEENIAKEPRKNKSSGGSKKKDRGGKRKGQRS